MAVYAHQLCWGRRQQEAPGFRLSACYTWRFCVTVHPQFAAKPRFMGCSELEVHRA
jgi:hypothetical protein